MRSSRLAHDRGANRIRLGLELLKVLHVPYGGRLDDFGHTIAEFARGQRQEPCSIDKYIVGLVKRANQVLAVRMVNRRFATDRRVYHRQQRRRNLHVLESTHERRSNKSHQVANHAATTGKHHGIARQAMLQHPVFHSRLGLATLALFTRRYFIRQKALVRPFRLLEGIPELVNRPQLSQVRVSHQHIGARRQLAQQGLYNMRHEMVAKLDLGIQTPQLMYSSATNGRLKRRRMVRRHFVVHVLVPAHRRWEMSQRRSCGWRKLRSWA